MMKKVLYGVAMALLAGASVGTLQSCKDDVSDLKTQTSFSLDQLRSELVRDLDKAKQDLRADMSDSLKNKLNIADLDGKLTDYAKKQWVLLKLDTLANHLTGAGSAVDSIKGDVTTINGWIETAGKTFNKLDSVDLKLAADIVGASQTLNTRIDSIGNSIQNNYVLKSEFNSFKSVVNNRLDSISILKGRIEANTLAIATLNSTIHAVDSVLGARIDAMGNRVDSVNNRVNSVELRLTGIDTSISDLNNSVDGLNSSVAGLQGAVSAINSELAGLTVRIATVEGDLKITKDNVAELKQKVYFLTKDIVDLRNDLTTLSGDVTALTQRVTSIEQQLNLLSTRLDNMVTSLLIQATDSPVFGNFSLPLGVKSSVLFNWYGYKNNLLTEFPSVEKTFDGLGNTIEQFVGMCDPIEVKDGFMGDVNLGTVYLTLNPVGHLFDPNNFSLETTAGNTIPSLKMDVKKSNQELYFGYSRDSEPIVGNGFYAAEVMIAGDNGEDQKALYEGISKAKITIDDNLKAAVKDILKDRTKRNAVDLLKAVYGQLNGKFPAYAVNYAWDNGKYSVRSSYDLAVATAKPLSYDSYKGNSVGRKIPTIGHIKNFIYELKNNGNLTFDFSGNTLELDPFSIKMGSINITVPNDIAEPNIVIGFDSIYVYGDKIDGTYGIVGSCKPDSIRLTEVDEMVRDINANVIGSIQSMKDSIDNWSKDVEVQINSQVNDMLGTIQTKVNDMMTSISGQINEKVQNIIDDFGGKADPWFNRLNRVVDLYNRFANKVNEVLADPNHYLQVAMFYNQVNNGIGMLSNSIESPTPFSGNGTIGLYASSYTGEIIAPAFKKYVACTNVYEKKVDPVTKKVTYETPANGGSIRYDLNYKAKNFNQVVDGSTIRFDIPTSLLKSGYIYEIAYQGLDYQGYTSTQKFYITVK